MRKLLIFAATLFSMQALAQNNRTAVVRERVDPRTAMVIHAPTLECDAAATNCHVRGMLFLNQSDSHIDPDVASNKPHGCYDTSIVTVVLAAMDNRSPKLHPTGRLKELMDIQVPPLPYYNNKKAYEQVSQQYRWQLAHGTRGGQAFGFPEVLADLAPSKAKCNPFAYGDCESFSNAAGETWSWSYKTGRISNQSIEKLLREGYMVLIGYRYYTPVVTQNMQGLRTVDFKPGSDHKVVFSGFQPGDHPLLIANVGSGQEEHVALRTDTVRFDDTPGLKVNYPDDRRLYLDIEGNKAVGFVDFIQTLKIDSSK